MFLSVLGAECRSLQTCHFHDRIICLHDNWCRADGFHYQLCGKTLSLHRNQTTEARANTNRHYLTLQYSLHNPGHVVMPFPYASSAASVRPRRLRDKDKDIRYRSSSTSSRRSKDLATVVDSRLLIHQPQATQQSPDAVDSATLDQLPPLPLSRTTSPYSAASSALQPQAGLKTYESATQPYYIHTPASLQPYLVEDTDSNCLLNSLQAESHHVKQPQSYSLGVAQRKSNPDSRAIKAESAKNYRQLEAENTAVLALSVETQQQTIQALPKVLSPAPSANQLIAIGRPQLVSQRVSHQNPSFGTYQIEDIPIPGCPPSPYSPSTQFDNITNDRQAKTAQIVPYLAGFDSPAIMPIDPDNVGTLPHHERNRDSFAYAPLQSLQPLGYSNANVSGQDQEGGYTSDYVSAEEDTAALMYRIRSTIPDIHLLMDRYRETLGQLAFQQNRTRQVEAQKSDLIKKKDIYIDHLAKEMDCAVQEHLAETSKYLLQIGNLEEKHKEIQENLDASMNSRIELESGFEKQMSRAQKEHALKDQAMRADIDAMIKVEAAVETDLVLIRRKHTEELTSVKETCFREKTVLENSHARERKNLEMVIQTCQDRLKSASRNAQDESEKWSHERSTLQREWNDQYQNLLVQHRNEIEELRKAGRLLYDNEQNRLQDNASRFQRQIDSVGSSWDADKARVAQLQNEHSARTSKLLSEIDRLQKMMDAFGEATDLRGRESKCL